MKKLLVLLVLLGLMVGPAAGATIVDWDNHYLTDTPTAKTFASLDGGGNWTSLLSPTDADYNTALTSAVFYGDSTAARYIRNKGLVNHDRMEICRVYNNAAGTAKAMAYWRDDEFGTGLHFDASNKEIKVTAKTGTSPEISGTIAAVLSVDAGGGVKWYTTATSAVTSSDVAYTWDPLAANAWFETTFDNNANFAGGATVTATTLTVTDTMDILAVGFYCEITSTGLGTVKVNNNFDVGAVEVTAIPEPATMALLAFGGLGILIRRKR